MMRVLSGLVLLVSLLSSCDAPTAPLTLQDTGVDAPILPPGPTLRVATYNVQRFFDPVCDSGACGLSDFEEQPTPEAFEARAQQIADAILRLDADVVLLQEIETERCMEALSAHLGETYPVQVLGESGGTASIDVAVVGRGEEIRVMRHGQGAIPLPEGGLTTFARELLEVELEIEGIPVIVFVAHFVSKRSNSDDRRLAEATMTHDIITQRARGRADALVVLGGDLNDTPGSPPLNALTDSGLLQRAGDELTPPQDATYIFAGRPEAIDHLLVALESGGTYRLGSLQAFWAPDGGWGGSDHAALRADFGAP